MGKWWKARGGKKQGSQVDYQNEKDKHTFISVEQTIYSWNKVSSIKPIRAVAVAENAIELIGNSSYEKA